MAGHFAALENPMLELESVRVRFPEDTNIIIGQTHFIKTAEDMYEAVVNTVPQAKFGLAFNESSGPCLTRAEGNDARGGQCVHDVRTKDGIDVLESRFDFSHLNIEELNGECATFFELASCDSPVGGKPPEHNSTFGELANGIQVLRRKAPVDGNQVLEFLQGFEKRRR